MVKDQFDLLESSIALVGYLIVSLVCIMGGCALNNTNSGSLIISFSSNIDQLSFAILLIPVLAARSVIYSAKLDNSLPQSKKLRKEFWVFTSVASIISILLVMAFHVKELKFSQLDLTTVLIIAIGLLPSYFMTMNAWKNWQKSNTEEYFNFRYYIFFPALAICINSFILGWLNKSAILQMCFSSVIILLYWTLSKTRSSIKRNWSWFDWIMLISICITALGLIIVNYDFKPVKTFFFEFPSYPIMYTIFLMALIMGLMETWWFMRSDGKEMIASTEMGFHQKNQSRLTILFLLLFPITIFNPMANTYYFVLLFFCLHLLMFWLYAQSLDHFKLKVFKQEIIIKYWWLNKIIVGMLFPLIVGKSLSTLGSLISIAKNVQSSYLDMLITITLVVGLTNLFKGMSDGQMQKLSIDKQRVIFLSSIILIFVKFMIQCTKPSEAFVSKLNIFQLFYVVVILCILLLYIGLFLFNIMQNQPISSGNGDSKIPSVSFLKKIKLTLLSGRPITSMLANVLSFIIVFNKTGDIIHSILHVFPIMIITMVGFIFNDIYDIEKDKLGGKLRPITTGKVNWLFALNTVGFLSIFSLLMERLYNNTNSFNTLFFTFFSVIFYSPISKKIPALKSIYTSLLCCTPLIYGCLVADSGVLWIKTIPIFLFMLGREFWLDKVDFAGDLKSGLKTLVYYFGEKLTSMLSILLMMVGMCSIVFTSESVISYRLSMIALLLLIFCIIYARRNEEMAISLSRIPTLIGIIALTI